MFILRFVTWLKPGVNKKSASSPSRYNSSLGTDTMFDVPMKISKTMSRRSPSLINKLLLVGLFLSSFTSWNVVNQARQSEGKPAPTSIRSANTVMRNHALTSSPGQRVAGAISKQSRIRHSGTYSGLLPGEAGAPPAIVRQPLVITDRSVLYLSFRLSRPGGRAPPAFA